jgi:hypothetical protein
VRTHTEVILLQSLSSGADYRGEGIDRVGAIIIVQCKANIRKGLVVIPVLLRARRYTEPQLRNPKGIESPENFSYFDNINREFAPKRRYRQPK